MANSSQSLKRARQGEKRRQQNMGLRTKLRTHIKRVVYSADAGDAEKTAEAYKAAVPVIDSSVNKGIIHINKAARLKSRLNTRLVGLQQA